MITDADIESAVKYLAESASEYAAARGRRVWLEESRKSKKAQLMLTSDESSAAMREADAYANPEYEAHLEQYADAVETEETLKAYRLAAEARIEVWRTQQASRRAANV